MKTSFAGDTAANATNGHRTTKRNVGAPTTDGTRGGSDHIHIMAATTDDRDTSHHHGAATTIISDQSGLDASRHPDTSAINVNKQAGHQRHHSTNRYSGASR